MLLEPKAVVQSPQSEVWQQFPAGTPRGDLVFDKRKKVLNFN
jgi:hypothetical protein